MAGVQGYGGALAPGARRWTPWLTLARLPLQLYSPAGRHLTAPLKLGAGIAKLACDAAWRLLVLTTSGAVRLFDVESLRSLLTASLAPLLEDGCTGQAAWPGSMGRGHTSR